MQQGQHTAHDSNCFKPCFTSQGLPALASPLILPSSSRWLVATLNVMNLPLVSTALSMDFGRVRPPLNTLPVLHILGGHLMLPCWGRPCSPELPLVFVLLHPVGGWGPLVGCSITIGECGLQAQRQGSKRNTSRQHGYSGNDVCQKPCVSHQRFCRRSSKLAECGREGCTSWCQQCSAGKLQEGSCGLARHHHITRVPQGQPTLCTELHL